MIPYKQDEGIAEGLYNNLKILSFLPLGGVFDLNLATRSRTVRPFPYPKDGQEYVFSQAGFRANHGASSLASFS